MFQDVPADGHIVAIPAEVDGVKIAENLFCKERILIEGPLRDVDSYNARRFVKPHVRCRATTRLEYPQSRTTLQCLIDCPLHLGKHF